MRTLRIVAWACALCTLSPTASLWGQNDAIPAQDSLEDRRIKRVTQLATFIPGAGQIANRKYWKAPVVWGGMAYCISSIDYNLTQLDAARAHLIELENNPATDFNTLQSARSEEAFYRRNRDLSWFALVGVHALSILDAHVDANLLSFDVSENLALHLSPVPAPHTAALLAPGLVIRWHRPGHKFTNFERSKRAHRAF
ncbi:MAG TPA: hypothetical protein DCY76_06635 [Flavobacteriales bacterium]|nr:hypothetical protein [Flavobacteriales bacterium]|tara:strand:- start:1348 stop:1941 length:594 start_codon:yes stop_codon:yes gene_type:complete